MAIKMNAKSKTLLTVLLVGSLCSLRASDLVEQEPKRLQITAATEQILDAIDNVSTSGQASAIQGTGFNTSTDSLVNISNNTTSVPLATLANQTTQGLVALATSAQAVEIEGTGFIAGASLMANAQRTAANQVVAIANSGALTATLVGPGAAAVFNSAMVNVSDALTDALTTQTNANIVLLQTAVTDAQGVDIVTGVTTSAYSAAQITASLAQLQASITNWLAVVPA